MFTAKPRSLSFPLDRALSIDAIVPDDDNDCEVPVFPEDSDEKVTVFFRLSLNEFVALASAIDAGSDIAYGEDSVKIWWLWSVAYMCAQFCEEVAECLTTENPAVVAALANLIQNNQTILNALAAAQVENGAGTPGQPLTAAQANRDSLPTNVKDSEGNCLPDALWGACLYLVQSGNRAITDVFDVIESASNTLERAQIGADLIPVIGTYIADAAEFADQLQEEIIEGYAAAYSETYEEALACELFCAARVNCELTIQMCVDIVNARLTSPIDVGDFLELMTAVITGTWTGDEIADIAFLLFFMALQFGQKFGDTIGIRPLTVLMGLGADVLASDNWETLCDCPTETCVRYDADNGLSTVFEPVNETVGDQAAWTGTGWSRNPAGVPSRITLRYIDSTSRTIASVKVYMSEAIDNGDTNTASVYAYPGYTFIAGTSAAVTPCTIALANTLNQWVLDMVSDASVAGGAAAIAGEITAIEITYTDNPPTDGTTCA